jgi:hypothetical protein
MNLKEVVVVVFEPLYEVWTLAFSIDVFVFVQVHNLIVP